MQTWEHIGKEVDGRCSAHFFFFSFLFGIFSNGYFGMFNMHQLIQQQSSICPVYFTCIPESLTDLNIFE